MTPVRFEPTISVGERLQTYALDRAATGTGSRRVSMSENVLTCGINLYSTNIEVILLCQLDRPAINEEILQAVKEESNIMRAIK